MKSILKNIKIAIDAIEWTSQTKKEKALNFCISIFDLYIKDGGDYYKYQSLSSKWIQNNIKTKDYIKEIKDTLVNNYILEINSSYNVAKHLSKGYRFNTSIINGDYTLMFPMFPKQSFKPIYTYSTYSTLSNLSPLLPLFPTLETLIDKGFQKLTY